MSRSTRDFPKSTSNIAKFQKFSKVKSDLISEMNFLIPIQESKVGPLCLINTAEDVIITYW